MLFSKYYVHKGSVSIRSISGKKAQSAEFKMLFFRGGGGAGGSTPKFLVMPPPPLKSHPQPT